MTATKTSSTHELQLLTANQVAKYLQVSPSTVYRMIRQGVLPKVTVGGSVRIRQSDLDAYLNVNSDPPLRPSAVSPLPALPVVKAVARGTRPASQNAPRPIGPVEW